MTDVAVQVDKVTVDNSNGNGNGKMVERRDWIMGVLFLLCLLAMWSMGYFISTTPDLQWQTVQTVIEFKGDFKDFALMILTGYFALSTGKK